MKSVWYITVFTLIIGVLLLLSSAGSMAESQTFCGDIDGNGEGPNISDVTYLVAFLFTGGNALPNPAGADVDGVWGINVSDLTYLVSFIFSGGAELLCNYNLEVQGSECVDSPALKQSTSSSQSECLVENEIGDSTEYMWIELIGNDLHVHHMNAYYQCCLGYKVDFDVQGYSIIAQETDTGELCDCYCYFNLESVLPDLVVTEPAEYVVTLLGIEGDTIGVDTLRITDSTYMYVDVVGHDLHVHHMNALANCCPEFYSIYAISGQDITVTEVDVFYGCSCLCYYNLKTVVPDITPGTYYVTLIGVCNQYEPCNDTIGVDTVIVGF